MPVLRSFFSLFQRSRLISSTLCYGDNRGRPHNVGRIPLLVTNAVNAHNGYKHRFDSDLRTVRKGEITPALRRLFYWYNQTLDRRSIRNKLHNGLFKFVLVSHSFRVRELQLFTKGTFRCALAGRQLLGLGASTSMFGLDKHAHGDFTIAFLDVPDHRHRISDPSQRGHRRSR